MFILNPENDHVEYSDEDLVRLLALGDSGSLEEISARHAGVLYSLAMHMLKDPGWAEEVVQDVLLRLWRKPEMFDSTRGNLRKWLLRLTHNAAVDELRSRRGTSRALDVGAYELDTLPLDGQDPFEGAWESSRAERVRQALTELPAKQREVVELAYYQGLTQSEIAGRTGQPLSTVKTRTRLAFNKLRDALEDEL